MFNKIKGKYLFPFLKTESNMKHHHPITKDFRLIEDYNTRRSSRSRKILRLVPSKPDYW